MYTDGSCTQNGTKDARGGYGVFFGDDDPRNICGRLKGDKITNNRAEMMAIVAALENCDKKKSLEIRSDSHYTINAVVNYAFSDPTKTENIDLIKRIMDLKSQYTAGVKFVWVKGHANEHGNEMADKLSDMGRRM